jgi:hypothetical protein
MCVLDLSSISRARLVPQRSPLGIGDPLMQLPSEWGVALPCVGVRVDSAAACTARSARSSCCGVGPPAEKMAPSSSTHHPPHNPNNQALKVGDNLKDSAELYR